MARLGLIADIHGNLEALRVALAFLAARSVDRVICLGDIVGYNADPNACVRLLQDGGVESIHGNHDLIAIGRLSASDCWYKAAHALRQTRSELTRETRLMLGALPAVRFYAQYGLIATHGCVADSTRYLRDEAGWRAAARILAERYPAARICFFGHTHEAGVVRVSEAAVERFPPRPVYELPDDRGCRYLVNPGAIDAARRDVKHAELAVYDSERRRLELHRIPYDHRASERKAVRGGFRVSRAVELWQAGRDGRDWLGRFVRRRWRRDQLKGA